MGILQHCSRGWQPLCQCNPGVEYSYGPFREMSWRRGCKYFLIGFYFSCRNTSVGRSSMQHYICKQMLVIYLCSHCKWKFTVLILVLYFSLQKWTSIKECRMLNYKSNNLPNTFNIHWIYIFKSWSKLSNCSSLLECFNNGLGLSSNQWWYTQH